MVADKNGSLDIRAITTWMRDNGVASFSVGGITVNFHPRAVRVDREPQQIVAPDHAKTDREFESVASHMFGGE